MNEDALHARAVEALTQAHATMKRVHEDIGPMPVDVDMLRRFFPEGVTDTAIACGEEIMNVASLQRLCLGVAGMLVPFEMYDEIGPLELVQATRFVVHGAVFGATVVAWMHNMDEDGLDRILLAKTAAAMDSENMEGGES